MFEGESKKSISPPRLEKLTDFVSFATSGLLLVAFLFLIGLSIYQLGFWQYYFFDDSFVIKSGCQYSAVAADAQEQPVHNVATLQPIGVPHLGIDLFANIKSDHKFKHVYYRCQFPTKVDKSGITNLHMGWVFAERAQIYLNGKLRQDFSGSDKPIIPLTKNDASLQSQLLEVYIVAEQGKRLGINGGMPMALTSGVTSNSKILGIETALQNIRPLFRLLPTLTMALILIVGWFLGVRTHLLVATMFYFLMVVIVNLMKYATDFFGWNIAQVYELSLAFEMGASFAYVLFGMQLTGLCLKWMWHLRFAVLTWVSAVALLIVYQREWMRAIADPLSHSSGILFTSLFLIAAVRRRKRHKPVDASLDLVEKVFLIIAAIFIVGQAADWILRLNGIYIRLNQQIDTVMPLFVGSVLLYHLATIQRFYEKEKLERQKIESDIALAREIQDSFAPPPPNTKYGDFNVSCYQIKHSGVAGDWMAVRETKNHGVLLLVADVTGKGVQAALVVHAIQSLWAEALSDEEFKPDLWVEKLNRTLVILGEHRPHSLTLGIVGLQRNQLQYWSFGHPPAYVVTADAGREKCQVLQARGNLIGIQSSLEYRKATLDIDPQKPFSLLVGTDGIFPNGSRTKPREVLELVSAVKSHGEKALDSGDHADDRTMIFVSRGPAT